MTSARKRNEDASVQENLSVVPSPEPVRIVPGRPPASRTSAHASTESWRELAKRIQNEQDSSVMIELVQELIAKLDSEKSRKL